jgi:uncharacterized membrane protein
MDNKYVRGLVFVVVGMVILIILLFVGDLIGNQVSNIKYGGDAWGRVTTGNMLSSDSGGPISGWLWWVLIGGVVTYLIYVLFAETEMFTLGTREVVFMAIGAALYGVLAWVFNIIPVPSVSLVALRPVVAIPIFFGFTFGPVVGFFTGAFGNVLGDALTGWGVYPIWDIGNGLMGLIPGLAGMVLTGKTRGRLNILLWISIIVLAIATVFAWMYPDIESQLAPIPMDILRYGMPIVVLVTVFAALAPRYWPILLILLTIGFVAAGVVSFTAAEIWFGILMLAIALLCAIAAWYLHNRADSLTAWLEDEDTRAVVIWGVLGVVVGIGFAAIADIFYNGYSIPTAIVGEFVPAGGPNTLFAVILTPLLYAAWKQARAQAGR